MHAIPGNKYDQEKLQKRLLNCLFIIAGLPRGTWKSGAKEESGAHVSHSLIYLWALCVLRPRTDCLLCLPFLASLFIYTLHPCKPITEAQLKNFNLHFNVLT